MYTRKLRTKKFYSIEPCLLSSRLGSILITFLIHVGNFTSGKPSKTPNELTATLDEGANIDVIIFFEDKLILVATVEQCALKNVNNCLNTNIYSYLETSGVQIYYLYLNDVHFSTPVLIRPLWQLKIVIFLHRCLIHAVLLYHDSLDGKIK
jgi:hypothetical protein